MKIKTKVHLPREKGAHGYQKSTTSKQFFLYTRIFYFFFYAGQFFLYTFNVVTYFVSSFMLANKHCTVNKIKATLHNQRFGNLDTFFLKTL